MMEGTARILMARRRGAVVKVPMLVARMRRDVLDVSSDLQKSRVWRTSDGFDGLVDFFVGPRACK